MNLKSTKYSSHVSHDERRIIKLSGIVGFHLIASNVELASIDFITMIKKIQVNEIVITIHDIPNGCPFGLIHDTKID